MKKAIMLLCILMVTGCATKQVVQPVLLGQNQSNESIVRLDALNRDIKTTFILNKTYKVWEGNEYYTLTQSIPFRNHFVLPMFDVEKLTATLELYNPKKEEYSVELVKQVNNRKGAFVFDEGEEIYSGSLSYNVLNVDLPTYPGTDVRFSLKVFNDHGHVIMVFGEVMYSVERGGDEN